MPIATADLLDAHADLQVLEPGFLDLGGSSEFHGPIELVHAPDDNSFVRSALESAGRGRVLVVDGEARISCALVGGNLAVLAQANGWSGVVVNGCVRDSAELAEVAIGVRARALHPRRSEKRQRGGPASSFSFGGVHFTRGQWMYADPDGVVIAPRRLH